MMELKPLVKWPGGKRDLAPRIRRLYDAPPARRYVECCLGGGAVFLARLAYGDLREREVVLVDAEARLMAMYRAVRASPDAVNVALAAHEWSRGWRDAYAPLRADLSGWCAGPDDVASPKEAALFLWVNRACFNGLYRVNAAGEFNAPAGSYETLHRPTMAHLRAFSDALRGVTLITSDTAKYLESAGEGDQVYVDPPYDDSYDGYTAARFGWDAQISLAQAAAGARDRGAFTVLSNSNTARVSQLYLELGFELRPAKVQHSIGASADARGKASELIIVGRPEEVGTRARRVRQVREPAPTVA